VASYLEDVLRVAEAATRSLALPGIGDNVQVGKLPGVEEELDTLPLLVICPGDEDEECRRADFEGNKFAVYVFDMVLISKGKRLLAASGNIDPNDDLYRQLDWRQQVRDRVFTPETFASVPVVKTTRVIPGRPVDRNRVNQNYDYSTITVRVFTQEPAAGAALAGRR
jgi:hypothetical protein